MIFFPFDIEIEGKGGWIIGGPKGMLAPPTKLLGGGGPGPPWPPPSSYAYPYAVTKIQCASNLHCLDGHMVVGSLDILLLIKLEASHLFEIFSLTIALIVIHFKVAMVENYM